MADIEIFGKLNKEIIVRDYTGGETETANVVVNNSDIDSERTVKANVKKVPHKLNIKDNRTEQENIPQQDNGHGVINTNFDFDGHEDILVSLDRYADKYKSVAYVTFASTNNNSNSNENNNVLRFYNIEKELLQEIDIQTFIQEQVDWNETNTQDEKYIKNKPTINGNALLSSANGQTNTINTFNNGLNTTTQKSLRFASEQYVEDNGTKSYEIIARVNSLPTANATSPDFVMVGRQLYEKVYDSTLLQYEYIPTAIEFTKDEINALIDKLVKEKMDEKSTVQTTKSSGKLIT